MLQQADPLALAITVVLIMLVVSAVVMELWSRVKRLQQDLDNLRTHTQELTKVTQALAARREESDRQAGPPPPIRWPGLDPPPRPGSDQNNVMPWRY